MPSERVQRQLDALLDRVESAVNDADWDAALSSIRAVLTAGPENADALMFKAMAEAALGSPVDVPDTGDQPSAIPSPNADETPASFANGRYEVKSLLGEGGKKKVYLAHDTTLDRDVAFGLIKAEGLDVASRQRITREAQAMARLGDHPNIMPIFDLGEEAGQPFMVQPLMGGGDVEALIESAENRRLPLEDALRIASEILSGLEFAHSKAIIHRDLKPGNIWLSDSPTGSGPATVRIGDFGLAISLDRSRLTQEKMMVGTVSYMPPEQATGGEITAQADLYSLGAMLYEMVTGRPPFMGDDDIAIIGQHINTPPVAPQWHNPDIPAQLDSLIMRLMSKNPAERPESASDVLAAIGAIDTSNASSPQASAGESGEPGNATGSLDAMASGVFVDRHAETDQLKAKLENALSGRGGMVGLVGEPGIGKTRTSHELETYAGLRSAQVLWGRCYEGGAPPYWPWVQAIRSYVTSRDPDELRREMGSTASVISEIVDDVKTSLPDLQPPAPLDDPESARFRLFDSIATFLKNASQVKPLVLILDDLHWADKPSLLLLEFVVRELGSSRVMLVGTYRDMELNQRHPLTVTLGDLMRERLFERVLLRGLTHDDVGRFIELAAGVNPPQGLIDAIHTQTEGNPLFVTETVRLFVQEGELTPENLASRDSWSIRTPGGVREIIGRRLDKLSERTNSVLTDAAVIGRQFTLDGLDALSEDLTHDRLLDVIDEGLNARVIEEFPGEVGQYQFSHAVIQQTLGDELSLTRRVRVHSRVAVAFEELYRDDLTAHAETLAYHFDQAQTIHGTEKVVTYSVMAGHAALESLGYDEALAHFSRANEARGDDPVDDELAEILFGLGRAEIYSLTGGADQNRGLGRLVEAFDHFRSQDDMARAAQVTIVPYQGVALPNSATLTVKAPEYLTPDSAETAISWPRRGMQIAGLNGDIDEALAAMKHGIEIAQRESMASAEAWGLYCLGSIQNGLGNIVEGRRSLEAALAAAQRAGDQRPALVARQSLAMSYAMTGDREIAEQHHDLTIDLARATKDETRFQQTIAFGLAFRIITGDYSHQDFEVEAEFEDIFGLVSRALAGWAAAEEDRHDTAQDLFKQALDEHLRRIEQQIVAAAPLWILAPILGGGIRAEIDLGRGKLGQIFLRREGDSIADHWLLRKVGAAAIAIHDQDIDGDLDRYRALLPYDGLALFGASADGLLGQLSVLIGDRNQASGHFEDAIQFCEKAGYMPEVAWAKFNYADALQKDESQAGKVGELQDGALAIALEFGMKLLTRRVLAQREMLKA